MEPTHVGRRVRRWGGGGPTKREPAGTVIAYLGPVPQSFSDLLLVHWDDGRETKERSLELEDA